ncbi:von Willebrand factor A domain-containing protein 7-like [Kryptolebias marmoratus]|nr:von Willebrand factor A domain-containing protein 7-like [Kryptolebias marmoratus]
MMTTDLELFDTYIDSLTAIGGGDFEELSLSGLQLALTGSPPCSEIFVFTDATAKDAFLRNAVIALIESTKSTVNFLLTNVLPRRRRRVDGDRLVNQVALSEGFQLYRDLARASGGQVIQVTKSQLFEATSVIRESISISLALLLQAARDPGKTENFTFVVDESVTNLIIYITGTSVDFTLIDPSGMIQDETNPTGSSIISYQSVGNFQTLQLQAQVGVWVIRMVSTNPYNLKVVGETSVIT